MAANKSNAKAIIVDVNGEFAVQPAAVLLEKTGAGQGDTLRIFNATNEDAVFLIFDGTVFTNNAAPQLVPIPKKKSISLQLDNGATVGVYSYNVLMAGGKKAKGNSDPVIIVEN